MATLQAESIADLVALTLKDLGKMKWTEIATDIQEHVAMKRLIRKEKVGFSSGQQLQWNLQVDHNNQARNVGLYEVDSVNVSDQAVQPTLAWRHTTTNYAYDEREIAMNAEPARIVDLLKFRRSGAMISLAERMETNFWSLPDDANDNLKPHGVPYWINYNATDGFTGGAQFGSTVAGINPSTYTRWKNYWATYTNVTKDDLMTKWRKASRQTNFVSPDEHPDYNTGNRYGYYTTDTVIGKLEELLEAQNDNLGNDLASKDGHTLFKKNPVTWAPKLDTAAASSSDPIYGINWGVFRPIFLKGEYLKEIGPKYSPKQHRLQEVHVDCTLNFICYDRRRLFGLVVSDPF